MRDAKVKKQMVCGEPEKNCFSTELYVLFFQMDGSMILVGETSEENQSFEAFLWLRSFDRAVWLLTLFSIIAAGVVYYTLELIDPKSDRGRFRNPTKAVYLSFITFFGHFDDFQPNTVASRLLAVSLGKSTSCRLLWRV